ncbi:hypothetical protein GOB93_18795 [Acetobacter musti]|uniref:Uncharacterized protein n=1 Tax=Acetobacter musti TaxID=864732 RepID=A0ABX0JXC9_9PROT|nr:hypothetical protein [Acetobacter musti]NHN86660.1 hypothetical protein [Acetobacter musti]
MPLFRAAAMIAALNNGYVVPAAFQVVQSPPLFSVPSGNDGAVSQRPLPDENRSEEDGTRPIVSHFRRANGYGRQVPLRFAVRQIVPRGVTVTFAPDIDTEAPVDWQGGREWNKVLASSVAQAGDVIDVGHNKVTIRRRIR